MSRNLLISSTTAQISGTLSPTNRNDNGLGIYSNMIYLDTVLYIVAGVCGFVLIASIVWFLIICKLGRFSDNPKYKRHQYVQSKYQSVSPDKNIIRSFNTYSRHYGTDQPQQPVSSTTTVTNSNLDYSEIGTPKKFTKKVNNSRELLFSVKSQPSHTVIYPSSDEGGTSNPVEVSDEPCSPSDSYYTAHSVYVTPTQPVINGDIFFRPCREKLDDQTLTSLKTDLPLTSGHYLNTPRKYNY